MSEALHARDAGDLLLAKEKVEMLIALAPNDKNVQALLLSINESIEEQGLIVPNDSAVIRRTEVSKWKKKIAEAKNKPALFSAIRKISTGSDLSQLKRLALLM